MCLPATGTNVANLVIRHYDSDRIKVATLWLRTIKCEFILNGLPVCNG